MAEVGGGASLFEETPPSTHASGRADEALFSEALQAADDLQGLVSIGGGATVTDRIDAMLLETIEAEMDDDEIESSMRSSSPSDLSTSNSSYDADLGSGVGGQPMRASEVAPGASASERSPTHTHESLGYRHVIPSLFELAAHVAYTFHILLWQEALRLLAVAPIVLWILLELDELVVTDPSLNRAHFFLWPLVSWLLGRLCAKGVAFGLGVWSVSIRLYLPLSVFLIFHSMAGWPLGIVASSIFNIAGPQVPLWGCDDVFRAIHAQPQFWSVFGWWLSLGLGFGLALGLVRTHVSVVTAKHYKARANEAYHAQTVLRKISQAARAKQPRAKQPRAKRAEATQGGRDKRDKWSSVLTAVPRVPEAQNDAPKDSHLLAGASTGGASTGPSPPTEAAVITSSAPSSAPPFTKSITGSLFSAYTASSQLRSNGTTASQNDMADLSSGLAQQLDYIAGPLQFGAGFEAASLTSARRKAARVFELLTQHTELLFVPEDAADRTTAPPPALMRTRLLEWTYAGKLFHPIGPNVLFGSDMVLDKEAFMTSVERCYKEQRLLTASVASFDQINVILIYVCMAATCFIIGTFYFFAIGVGFTEFLLPSVSLLISFILIAGRAPSDFLSGAFYVLLARPYDIGDRITTADPGRAAELYSLVVKNIGLFRTHFLTSNGELLYIDNHALINKSITNLTRSGPITLMIRVQVPVATSASKITELVDSIGQYVEQRSTDWTGADILISAIEAEAGHLVMDIWATSNHPSHEVLKVYSARSALFLFVHAYMQSASIDYVRPVVPIRIESQNEQKPHMV